MRDGTRGYTEPTPRRGEDYEVSHRGRASWLRPMWRGLPSRVRWSFILPYPPHSSFLLSSPGLIAASSPVRHRACFRSGAVAPGRAGVFTNHSHISTVRERSWIAWSVMSGWWACRPSAGVKLRRHVCREHCHRIDQDSFEPRCAWGDLAVRCGRPNAATDQLGPGPALWRPKNAAGAGPREDHGDNDPGLHFVKAP